MSDIARAVDQLLDATDSREALSRAAHAVIDLGSSARSDELADAVRTISGELDPEYAEVSGVLALTAGALVERGAVGAPLANRIVECLPPILRRATEFGEFALGLALPPAESADVEDDGGGEWIAGRFVPAERFANAADQDPDGIDAWAAIPRWSTAAVACLTRDADARKRAVKELPSPARLRELNESAHCLFVLLQVLDDEPFLVFHPSAGAGFRLRVSGVADNFQLHTLLADTLLSRPKRNVVSMFRKPTPRLPGTPPEPLVAAVARGDGPQTAEIGSRGVWDLYNWTALQPDGTLPSTVSSEHWIWGEGIPADIRPFEGSRIILLAPPSYARGWNTARYFSALRASVVVEEVFTEEGAKSWLQRLGRAAPSHAV